VIFSFFDIILSFKGAVMMEAKKIDKDLEWLRRVSKKVILKEDDITEDVKLLEDYCLNHGVFAMAAIQLGIDKRIIYIKNTRLDKIEDDDWNEGAILINPVIKMRVGLTQYWEACASCLDNIGLVFRPYKILIEYIDLFGKKHQKTFKGFPATVFSHEYDHLDGVLHMDKAIDLKIMTKEERKEFRKTHGYEVLSVSGEFLELEKNYGKRSKN
jgi:peptide deformylase